jgi:pimeloyl-ACP methyl ester carboxylesterase
METPLLMKRLRLLAMWLLLPVLVIDFSGCKNSTDVTQSAPVLVGSTEVGTVTRAQISNQLSALGLNLGPFSSVVAQIVQRDVKTYRITYKTKNTDGTDITASGALIVPVATSNDAQGFPILSQQHGTIFDDSQAPSYFGQFSESSTLGTLFASNKYIIAMPDYIGFGESKNVPHPYIHRQTQASASLDMLRAARDFVQKNNVNWNGKVFLSGYSQGGHATMSLLKMMEEQFPTEFTISAATCGAGPYNVEGFMNDLINKPTHGIASYNNLYISVLQMFNRVYGLNRPMSSYFKAPYAADVQANGNRSNVNVSINTTFADSFRTGLNNGSDTEFLRAVRDNNVYDWKPKTPLQLIHGTADQQVFYRNTTDAFTAMQARGATNVERIPVEGKDHGPAIQEFILYTYSFFNGKR